MDPLPQIPSPREPNDTVGLIRNVFQEDLEYEIFPRDLANNLKIYNPDDNLGLKETATNVLKVRQFKFFIQSQKNPLKF